MLNDNSIIVVEGTAVLILMLNDNSIIVVEGTAVLILMLNDNSIIVVHGAHGLAECGVCYPTSRDRGEICCHDNRQGR